MNPKFNKHNTSYEEALKSHTYDEAIKNLRDTILSIGAIDDTLEQIYCRHLIARLYLIKGNFKKAKAIAKAAIESIEPLRDNNKSKTLFELTHSNVLSILGAAFNQEGKYFEAARQLETARRIKVADKTLVSKDPFIIDDHLELATSYKNQGDFERSLNYYSLAIHLSRYQGDTKSYRIARAHNGIGLVNWFLGEYDYSMQFLLQAREHFINTGTHRNYLAEVYNDLGIWYWKHAKDESGAAKARNFKRAEQFLKRSISLFTRAYKTDIHPLIATCYNDLAMVKEDNKDKKAALNNYIIALNIRKRIYGNHHPEMGRNLNNLGVYFRDEHQEPNRALKFFQSAMFSLVDGFKHFELDKNPDIILDSIDSIRHLLYSLEHKTKTLFDLFEAHGQMEDLELACHTVNKAIELIDETRNKILEGERSKLFYNTRVRSIFELAIQCYKTYNDQADKDTSFPRERILSFIEKGKAFLLLEQIQNRRNRHRSHLIQKAAQEEDTISNKSADLESEMSSAGDPQEQQILQEFKQDLSIEDLQKEIDDKAPHAALLNFFMGKQKAYVLVVKKESFHIVDLAEGKLPWDMGALQKEIKLFKDNWQEDLAGFDKALYVDLAHRLYLRLIKPIESLIDDMNRIYIMPHDELAYIPFEALLTESATEDTPYWEMFYWLYDYQVISYHHSATLLYDTPRNGANRLKKFYAGFAPDNNQLPQSVEVVPKICELLRNEELLAESFLHDQAKIDDFFKALREYTVVHLSAHNSQAHDPANVEAGIQIRNENGDLEYLTVAQLEANKDKADKDAIKSGLVILDSCSTGDGQLILSEGLISFHRAFLLNGASNLIYTLFPVPVLDSRDLMISYFEQLINHRHTRLVEALCEAKKALIDKQLEFIAPKSWAGFVYMGNQQRTI